MYELLEKLASTSKRKEKEEILAGLDDKEAQLFKKVATLCYGHLYEYYLSPSTVPTIEQINESESEQESDFVELDLALDVIAGYGVSGSGFSSNENKQKLINLLKTLKSDGDREVVRCILKGNLGCGVSSSTVNKVWPDTIFIPPYMRCDTLNAKNYDKQKSKTRFVQTKIDGEFQNIIFDLKNSKCHFFSRYFKDYTEKYLNETHTKIAEALSDGKSAGFVLNGEVGVLDDSGNILPRDVGNGYLNRDDVDHSRLVFIVWDYIDIEAFYDGKWDVPYEDRFDKLARLVNSEVFKDSNIKLIDNTECSSVEEVIAVFKNARARGEEGIICKSTDGIWKHGTSKDQLKAKVAVDCDVRIVGINYSEETKYAGMIGSIEIESSCGLVNCDVGSGLKDSDRSDVERFLDYIESGKIFKIRYNDVVENELKPGKYALYLPRIIEPRDDKTEADSYEKIFDQLSQYELDL